mmetsp:Transcript_20217/g.70055  ORF Transcript_20217/g.70055 Transcript_20217/m.70055 type:complete len:297 (-) Transcript_20217:212-1102(-)
MISLNCIAHELEDPFGDDSNDFNLKEMQSELNKRLLMLVAPETQLVPEPSPTAQDLTVQPGRRSRMYTDSMEPATKEAIDAANVMGPTLTAPLKHTISDVDLLVLQQRERVMTGVPSSSIGANAASSKEVRHRDDSSDISAFPSIKGSPAPSLRGADLPPESRLRPDPATASSWLAPGPPRAGASAPAGPMQVPSSYGPRHSAPLFHASPASMHTRGPSSDLASPGSSVSSEQAAVAIASLQKTRYNEERKIPPPRSVGRQTSSDPMRHRLNEGNSLRGCMAGLPPSVRACMSTLE